MRPLTALLVLAAAGALLSACGTDPGTAGSTSGEGASPSERPTTPIVSRSEILTPTTPAAKVTRLTGRVAAGVEVGCTVLRAEGGAVYTLIGDLSSLPAGTGTVTVVGRLDPDLLSHCQQGPVFVVTGIAAS